MNIYVYNIDGPEVKEFLNQLWSPTICLHFCLLFSWFLIFLAVDHLHEKQKIKGMFFAQMSWNSDGAYWLEA